MKAFDLNIEDVDDFIFSPNIPLLYILLIVIILSRLFSFLKLGEGDLILTSLFYLLLYVIPNFCITSLLELFSNLV